MRLIGHNWDKFVALSAIVFVAVMCAAILTIYNDPYEQAINPVYQKQETAGPVVDQAVGEAVEKYLKVLNAEWLDKDCTLSHCATSSKAIPGVPDERSAFTKQERVNLVGRDSERACFAPIIGFAIYSVAAHNNNSGGHAAWAGISGVGMGASKPADSTVSTIVYGTIIERNSMGEAVRSIRIPQRITKRHTTNLALQQTQMTHPFHPLPTPNTPPPTHPSLCAMRSANNSGKSSPKY